jgi:FOG: TPR repeat, SEL1 subfamily
VSIEISNKDLKENTTKCTELSKETLVSCQLAANHNDPQGQFFIGMAYLNGVGFPKDDEKAVFWLQKSSKQGFDLAENELAHLTQDGKGIEKNEIEAADLYNKSARQGVKDAMLQLGKMIIKGEGVEKDASIGLAWIRLSESDIEKELDKKQTLLFSKNMSDNQKNNAIDYEEYLKTELKIKLH